MPVIHRARGWHAVWTGRTSRWSLPGDTRALVGALHQLSESGALPPNKVTPGWPQGLCPRCGRLTAVTRWGDIPTVCTGCRAERMAADQPRQLLESTEKRARKSRRKVPAQPLLLDVKPACATVGCTASPLGGAEYCQSCRLVAQLHEGSVTE